MDPSTSELLWVTNERVPIAVAFERLLLPTSAKNPNMLLLTPTVLLRPAPSPKNELSLPVVEPPAPAPKNELKLPGLLNTPALGPANKLFVPGLLRIATPPNLYCVVAFTTLPFNVPPAVPSPLMLKLL